VTSYTEDFAAVSNGANVPATTANGFLVVKVGTGSMVASTAWTYPGASGKSAAIAAPVSTDAAYLRLTGLSDSSESAAVGMRFSSLPNAGTSSCTVLSVRNAAGKAGYIIYGGQSANSGNVFKVLDAAGAIKHTSPVFIANADYWLSLVVINGASTSTGRLISAIYQNGSLVDSYDSGTTVNTGTTTFSECRWGKADATATLAANFSYLRLDSGSSALIAPPTSVVAAANAGLDAVLEPFQGWQPGDAGVARAQLDGTGSTGSGGALDYAWSGTTGVTFDDATDPRAQAILPQKVTDQTYTLTLTVSIGATSSSDTVDVTVRASDWAWLDGSTWKPARMVGVNAQTGLTPTWYSGIYPRSTAAASAAFRGKAVDYVHDFQTRSAGSTIWSNYDALAEAQAAANNGWTGRRWMISVAPWATTATGVVGSTGAPGRWDDAAAGNYDTHYDAVVSAIMAAGQQDCLVRFGWEANGNWSLWSTNKDAYPVVTSVSGVDYSHNPTNADQRDNYITVFKRFVTKLRAAGFTGLVFYSPAHGKQYAALPDPAYIADGLIDYIDGIDPDAYNREQGAATDTYPERWADVTANLSRGMNFWRDYCQTHFRPDGVTKLAFGFGEWGLWDDSSISGGSGFHPGVVNDDVQYMTDMRAYIDDCVVNRGLDVYEAYFNVTASDGDHYIGPNATVFPNAATQYTTSFGN